MGSTKLRASRHAALVLVLTLGLSTVASGVEPGLEMGLGFTSGPSTALVTTAIPIALTPQIAVGPLLQLGFGEDDRVVMLPTLDARFTLPLGNLLGDAELWDPLQVLLHGGVGFAYLEEERIGDDDDIGFLFNFGGGIQYEASDRVSLGTRMTFNVMPSSVLDEDFVFSWQLLTLRVRF